MYCSNCSAEISADQQFCRSCGNDLAAAKPVNGVNFRFLGLAALITCFLGVFAALSGDMLGIKWLAFAGLFVSLAGVFSTMIVAVVWGTRPNRRRVPAVPTKPQILGADTTNKLLPIGVNDFVPSVTEKTTDLLKVPNSIDG